MWALMKGPLLIGTDLTNLTKAQIAMLQNKYILAFNQDPVVGAPAKPYKWGINPDWTFNSTYPAMYWSGASSNGTIVAMMNPSGEAMSMSATFSEIPELQDGKSYNAIDVWTGEDMGCVASDITVKVASNDTAIYLLGAETC